MRSFRCRLSPTWPSLLGTAAVLLFLAAGCGGAREAGEREPFVIESDPEPSRGLTLAPIDSSVKSIQLYRVTARSGEGFLEDTGSEVQFPVIALGSIDQLELEFDLMETGGRPLSVYFYHADANWRRDLTPAEYLGAFHRDELIAYTPSRATDVAYAHYAYRFPNSAISFLISGNYIVRVTEQGMEEEVLFERPFFVSEQAVGLQVGIENRLMGDRGFNAVLPSASFVPPTALQPNVYDFSVCFVRNGRFEAPRCADQPRLIQSPSLLFYPEPRQAFEPVTSDYFLDLSFLRVGNQIARIDFGSVPYRVVLEPDYARFPGNPIAPFLRGQPVISGAVTDVANPDVAAQYALVQFHYVTDTGRRVGGGVRIVGSFNGWMGSDRYAMTWNEAEERYEAELLLKQGQYEYRYEAGDGQLPRGTVPRPENLYTALVYYDDLRLQTDRLMAIGGLFAP